MSQVHKISKIIGQPGTGKSTELLRLIAAAVDKYGSSRVGAISFTKSAVSTIQERISAQGQEVPRNCRTVHSHCFNLLGIKQKNICDKDANPSHFKQFCEDNPMWDMNTEGQDESDFVFRFDRHEKTNDDLFSDQKILRNCMIPIDQWPDQTRRLYEAWSGWLDENGYVDHTGYLEQALKERVMLPVDVLMIDECQDLSRLQMAIIDMWLEGVQSAIFAGDSDQCQPAGTMISTIRGVVPIEELQSGDTVNAYARRDGSIYQEQPVETSSRTYSGEMYSVSAGEATTRATDNHLWITRWDYEKIKEKSCVYLMSKVIHGREMFRVGWCQIINSERTNHLRIRARMEGANKVWLLRVCDSRQEASLWESWVASKFNISTVLFNSPDNAVVYTPEQLDFFWGEMMSTCPINWGVFDFFKKKYQYPMFTIDRAKRHRHTIMETATCNLFPEIMKIPVPRKRIKGGTGVEWVSFELSSEPVVNVPVYSLNVRKYHTYIADGIITHNCIFRFAGAVPEVFMDLECSWRRVLDQSYRVPQNILEYSQRIIRQVSRREDVEYRPCDDRGLGAVVHCDEPDLSLPGTHMILGRTNRVANAWVRRLAKTGIIWHNPLRKENLYWNPTHTDTWRAFDTFKRLQNGELVSGKDIRTMVEKMAAKGNLRRGLKSMIEEWPKEKLQKQYSLFDLYYEGFSDAFLEGQVDTKDWLKSDAQITKDIERLHTFDEPRVLVGTEHSVKGGEADHVWVDTSCSKTMNDRLDIRGIDWDDECRLSYVAATRAKQTLGIMSSSTRWENPCFP